MLKPLIIDKKEISQAHPPYIIAELSANHNGSILRAKKTILEAKNSGVSAVKIQTYTPDTMTIKSSKKDFLINHGLWKDRSLYDLYSEAYTPFEWHKELFDYAKSLKITIFSSPFDETAVDLLESLETPAYKVSSFELVDLPLIEYIAKRKKPMIMSTGMATLNQIEEAVETARINGCNDIVLLHCVSTYPTKIKEVNLNSIIKLKNSFDVHIGFSDHTKGLTASMTSIALGAVMLEKHFTLSRSDGGVDSQFSVEPIEMKQLVQNCNDVFISLGNFDFKRSKNEKSNEIFRRSIYFVEDLEKGDTIEVRHIRRIRPGYGLPPKFFKKIIGSKVKVKVQKGDRVTLKNIEIVL